MNESNRSNNPPWPGIRFPESFIDDCLFKIDTHVSPMNEKRIINKVKRIEFNELISINDL